jgi:4-oxalomesaconate tautomerase
MDVAIDGPSIDVRRSALVRTARRLMRGEVFVPAHLWNHR